MKQLAYILLLMTFFTTGSCTDIDKDNPYDNQLHTLQVNAVYPDEYSDYLREGVTVKIEDIDRGNSYTSKTDKNGTVRFSLTKGIYRIQISDKAEQDIFNGLADKVKFVNGDLALNLPLVHSRSGDIVIKEIYCGGCTKLPFEGNYQSDKYMILHNNTSETQYLDGLCFGSLDPYNSQATNVWVTQDESTGATIFPDFLPVAQCVWQFGGTGQTFPLAPGEDAVVVICGAIDHAAQYTQSVNLNKPGYFVCYNPVYFWNTLYHPAPGDQITPDHYLNVVIKTGQANAYTFSVFSPATVLFKAKDTTIQDFVSQADNVIQKPGSTVDRTVKVPVDWVLDAVEIYYGGSSNNMKRMPPSVDAGYVTQSALYDGRTLYRHTDEEASREAGYEILEDTNNSSSDFYEREKQSLHE
ncbi:DUF4876 domain-containing protein [Bacteroides acidifaciens]|uniref:DUF4876 domain-containing protein n=2 Tax=Bacteroides acidifaciens TaxID=85831 RepID=A0A7K3MIY3_9BACE|nr:DUF4876 domain-containing protein [Bacteroides acidifaciens]MBF0728425.1 DUF4876 domain-containing protein [Bacteroides acidifaciens]MBF0833975.1 DUF4876 domain-containing protein [Bacteroides acidifaciens]NDO54413.1 DUF4876 domain-containing protein [Bacteroides acidifaciens]TFU52242.1 DUF4876 domain-containing protein [Bacteroides acidifaciens]